MSILTWRKEPPDSAGVWLFSVDGVNASGACVHRDQLYRDDAWWCRIGDVPVIKEATKYREPTAADVGREVEVSDDEIHWSKRMLAAVVAAKYRFLIVHPSTATGFSPFRYAASSTTVRK